VIAKCGNWEYQVAKSLENVGPVFIYRSLRRLPVYSEGADELRKYANVLSRMEVYQGKRTRPKITIIVLGTFTEIVVSKELVSKPKFTSKCKIYIPGTGERNVFQTLPPCASAQRVIH
jgi:hypothetical protein